MGRILSVPTIGLLYGKHFVDVKLQNKCELFFFLGMLFLGTSVLPQNNKGRLRMTEAGDNTWDRIRSSNL